MTTYANCQNGSIPKSTKDSVKTVFEYPKRIKYKGTWVTLVKDSSVVKINRSRIDFRECSSLLDSSKVRIKLADLVIDENRVEILSLRSEVLKFNDLMKNQNDTRNLLDLKINGLQTENKKLRRKTGFLGGVVAVLVAVTVVIALK